MSRTKFVCTIGPRTESPEMLGQLIDAGMNVARLNFSHGDHDSHRKVIRSIREIADKKERSVAILQDLSGPKIRTGAMASGTVILENGKRFTLTSRNVAGDVHETSLTYKSLPGDVEPGDTIFLADGALNLLVEETTDKDIRCRVVTGGPLSSGKGINLPDRTIRTENPTARDRDDLVFGIREGVDYIALSFVRSGADILRARELIRAQGADTPIIAKIEKFEAINNLNEIMNEADGVMVARGDLGVEIPLENVPRMQKLIIQKANRAGKPVITATQMLKSMVESPRPTRAEVTDVANAILDGTDAVMLSEETAIGDFPVVTMETMGRIATEAESIFPHTSWDLRLGEGYDLSTDEAVARAACQVASRIGATAIITCTESGSTTRLVAKHRPPQRIIAATADPRTYRALALVWGCCPLEMVRAEQFDEIENNAIQLSLQAGLVKAGECVVITAGIPLNERGQTNLIKVSRVRPQGA